MGKDAVIVAGEALIDLAPDNGGLLRPLLGGGPFNTARALGRLGQPTVFVGAVSRDRFGESLSAALAADGVLLPPGLREERPTSLALAEIDAEGRADYRFYFSGTAAESLTPQVALAAAPTRASALYVGGLGLVLEPLADAVEALVERFAGSALVMVDPNVRPNLITDSPRYHARLQRIFALADVVKASDEDLSFLSPGQAPAAAAQALLGKGPELVLLTLGPEGALAVGDFGLRRTQAPRVTVVDTIGAGDTFSGAWLAEWLAYGTGLDDADAVEAAMAFAGRAAAYVCAQAGASPPTREELDRFPPRSAAGRGSA